MKTKSVCLLLAGAIGVALHATAQVPTIITYQGRVQVSDSNFTGTGQFKFALVDAGSNAVRQATAVATVTSGFITGIAVIDGGAGYTSPPTVTITDATGSGATAAASASGGAVTSITVLSAGSGYSASPAATIAPPPPNLVYVTHWSNDGSSAAGSEPAAAISLPVTDGLFTARLGDAALANMTSIPPDVLTNRDVHLRIWFNDGTNGFAALSPDQPLSSAPYALHALNAGGVSGPVPASLLTGLIAPVNLADGGIITSKLAADSVTGAKIADGAIQMSDLGSGVSNAFWRLGGNSGTEPGTDFLGTTDDRPLEFRVNSRPALRLLPTTNGYPNLLGGVSNVLGAEVQGATVAGGFLHALGDNLNAPTIGGGFLNNIQDFANASTIGGGAYNTNENGNHSATIAGGSYNLIRSFANYSTIAGGFNNQVGRASASGTVAGGEINRISSNSTHAVISGGFVNTVSAGAPYATVAGGGRNSVLSNASRSFIAGGWSNVVGGRGAFAAGQRAKANHQGAFVWADSLDADFASTASNQFNVRASGGVRFETGGAGVSVDGQPVLAGQVNASQLADGAVTAGKLAANSVTSTAIAIGAVDTTRLADGAVTAAKVFSAVFASQRLTLTNPTPDIGDQFGAGIVAIGPDRILVAAHADDTGANNGGVAHLFDLAGKLLVTLTNPAPASGDQFAQALGAVGADKLVIGVPLDDPVSFEVGSVYVYNTAGALLRTIANPTPVGDDRFGIAVAGVGSDAVLIGAPLDDTGATDAGAAYLFDLNGTLLTTITNPFPASGGGFGATVAAFGTDRLLIASSSTTGGPLGAGAAYLFDLNGGLLATFNNPNPSPDHSFGASLAAVGADKVLIGAFRDDASAPNAGAAYLFGLDGTLLTTFTNPTPGNFELFGRSVADAGSGRVLIGCPNDTITGTSAGATYLFDVSGRLLGTLTNANPQTGDSFGAAVSMLGEDKVLVGTPLDNTGVSDAGAAYVFSLSTYAPGLVSDGVKPGSITSASLADGAVTHLGTPDGSNPRALQVSDSGAVGIGTLSPAAPLHVVGSVIVEGAAHFDIEANRLELGENATAGAWGTAIGFGATATGTSATALGRMTAASGNFSTAIGDQTMATGGASTALGFATIASGGSSTAMGFATRANGNYSTALGNGSIASGAASFAVGEDVEAGGNHSSVGGGLVNSIQTNAHHATISGGRQNTLQTNAQSSAIGGGYLNTISRDSQYSMIGGGYRNVIQTNASYATIAGGYSNTNGPQAHYSTISGGIYNVISNNSAYCVIGGGQDNRIDALALWSTIAGGAYNTNGFSSQNAAIGGGWRNSIRTNAHSSVIAGGYWNAISNNSSYCVISGGQENRIDGGSWYSTIAGGRENRIFGADAYNTIAGGHSNRAAGGFSFAAGQQARATNYGSFVWSDGSIGAVSSFGANTFTARAAGGARFYTIADLSVGVNLPAGGGAWAPISDRAVKENVRPVDSREVLEKVAALPLNTWNYKSQAAAIRHIGPMAQDFHAAFSVGEDERHITTIDADGVALAAIQGLNQKLEKELRSRDAEIGELKQTVSELKALVRELDGQRRERQ